MARAYDAQAIELSWQDVWAEEGTYEVSNDDPRPHFYALCMYPYPSGEAHQGHVRNYTFGDLVVRYKTMRGFAVLSPFGFDSFGLPAENAAIKTGTHPGVHGSPDHRAPLLAAPPWRRLRPAARAQEPRSAVHPRHTAHLPQVPQGGSRLPGDGAGQLVPWVPDGAGQRAGTRGRDLRAVGRPGGAPRPDPVVLPHTSYADELLDSVDALDWPERVKTMQRNWIGRSEGVEFDLQLVGHDGLRFRVFTTRPDTGFGVTYAVLAPEHPLLWELTTPEHRDAVQELYDRARSESEVERSATLEGGAAAAEKRGAFTGSYVINPFNGAEVPVYVADYVLGGYGTGAIMAVPAEDQRDFDFAQVHGLEVVRTVQPPDDFEARVVGERRQDQLGLPGRPRRRRGEAQGDDLPRARGRRRREGQLPAPGLAALEAAILGVPDPGRPLRARRHRRGAGRPVAGPGARRRDLRAVGSLAARDQRLVPQDHVPEVRWTR